MTDDTTRRSTPLLIENPSPALLQTLIRNQILASAGPHKYDREVQQGMRGTSPQATALRKKFGEVTAQCRLDHEKQLAEHDELIAAATTDDERRVLTQRKEKLKPPTDKVSQQARRIAGPLTNPESRGGGKNLPKIPPEHAAKVCAEIHANPELLLTKYRSHVAHRGVMTGRPASWQEGSASQRRLHGDLVGVPLTEWPSIWPEHRRGRKAAADFTRATATICDDSQTVCGTPLTNHDVTFGTAPELRMLSVVEVARNYAAHETQTIAQHSLNQQKRAEADDLDTQYQRHEEWRLVQCLERDLEDIHARSGNKAKESFRITFAHLGGHKQLFERLRDALDKGASPDDLCALVETIAENSRVRFGYVALYRAACQPHYHRLWDSRAESDPDNLDKHNWITKRASYNRLAKPRKTPQRALPHFIEHPLRSLYRQDPQNSFKLGEVNLHERSLEIVDQWRGQKSIVSATFARNSQIKPVPCKKKEVRCVYLMGSNASRKRRSFNAVIVSLSCRIHLTKAYYRISSDLRARASSNPDWSPDFVDELVEALLPEVIRDRMPVYFVAALAIEAVKSTSKAFLSYKREIRKRVPDKNVLAELMLQLQGLRVRGIDSGTANGGGLAILRFAGPDHPVPEGKTPLHIVEGVVTVYRESSEVILLPGEKSPQTPEERRLWTLYEQTLKLIRVQQNLISSGRRGQGDAAAKVLAETLSAADLSTLRGDPAISKLLEEAADVGNFMAAARILEQSNRLAYRFVRREEKRISKARGRRNSPRDVEQAMLGGQSHRRIKLLEKRVTWLKNYAKREFVSRGGIIRAYQTRGVDALQHIADGQKHRTNLKVDRTLQVVAATRTQRVETVATVAENLSSFRVSVERQRSTNKTLAVWSHQEIDKRHLALSALTGEVYDTVNSHFTSRFSAMQDGAPGIRMEKIGQSLSVNAKRDIEKVPYPLDEGDYYPRSDTAGEYLVTLDAAGNPFIELCEESAATNIALRGISPWTEDVVMFAVIVPGGVEPLVYNSKTRQRLVPTRSTYGGDVFVVGRPLRPNECLDGKELKLMRDPSARFFGFGEWVDAAAYWRCIQASILHAMYATRIRDAAAE